MLLIYSLIGVFVLAVLLDEIGSALITAFIQLTVDEHYEHRPMFLKSCLYEVNEVFILLGGLALLAIAVFVEGVKGESADDQRW